VRILEQGGFFQEDLVEQHGVNIVMSRKKSRGNSEAFKENKVAYADRNLFDFFTIPLIEGNKESVLSEPGFVALSKSTAEKYFGDKSPLGEELLLNDSMTLVVTGVYEDMPRQSRLNYDFVISNEGLLTKWSKPYWGGTVNFIKLAQGSSLNRFEQKINKDVKKYWGEDTDNGRLFLQPLTEVTFSGKLMGDEGVFRPSRNWLITLGVISIVILAMAWINYINLSIARLNARMKEFATRRANGALSTDLIGQFLIESLLINLIGISLSVTFIQLIRHPLALYFDIHVAEVSLTLAEAWIPASLMLISGIAITGTYPALVCIARNKKSLYNSRNRESKKNLVTSVLTTVQFSSAIVLISWVFLVYLQLNFILRKDIGMIKDGVIIIEAPLIRTDKYNHQVETFINELKVAGQIQDATLSRHMIGDLDGDKPGKIRVLGTEKAAFGDSNGINENYIPFFGLRVLAGRNFVTNDRADAIILTRRVAERMGFTKLESAIGVKVAATTGNWNISREAEVIGIIDDYRMTPFLNVADDNTDQSEGGYGSFFSYQNKMFPELTPEKIAVKVTTDDVHKSIEAAESLYKKFFPGNPFEWRFLEERINRFYASEKIAQNQILLFTIVAIGIASLGLIAMMTQRIFEKTKEIGIRKVFGAKSFQIGRLLVNSLLAQFGLAAIVAIPIIYYQGNDYLNKYSERTSIMWWHYLVPLALLLVMMFIAISSMLWKAVKANPVESLRSE